MNMQVVQLGNRHSNIFIFFLHTGGNVWEILLVLYVLVCRVHGCVVDHPSLNPGCGLFHHLLLYFFIFILLIFKNHNFYI